MSQDSPSIPILPWMAERFLQEDNLLRVNWREPYRKTLRNISSIKVLVIFAITLSFASLPGVLSPSIRLPTVNVAHAAPASNQPWVPAGPSIDFLNYRVFTDEGTEFTAFQATPPPIDAVDWPLDPATIAGISPLTGYQVTSPISDTGYFELQFMMGQNNMGCQFNFGNSACGVQIRQAFAHGVDKNIFITTELGGNGQPIDNPVPPSVDLNTPDPCAWDATHVQSGSGCIVNGAGATAYHLAAATSGNCVSKPTFAYTPGCGTPDFCAAADHLIAAGLATGKDPTTCVLTGPNTAAITANPMQIFVRSDNTPRLHVGNSYVQFICALFTGSFATGCGFAPSTINIITANPGPITAFPGFTTSNTSVALTWDVYTAGFGNVLTFDSSLFQGYDSRFVSGITSIIAPSGPCASNGLGPSFAPGNYMYICNGAYDAQIEQAEFAPCLTAPGDPTTGQTHLTVTFANCSGTSQLSAASAAYKAQDLYGQSVYTIPWYSGKNQFATLTGWTRSVLNKGDGFTPPGNFFQTINVWQATPPVPGTFRQGYKQGTGSVSPFIGNTVWDAGIQGSIWDGPGVTNPDSPQAYIDWMTIKTDQIPVGTLSYTAPPTTVAAFRYTLRNDIFWQTGQKVTAWDLAFSDMAFKASGVGGGLAPVVGIKVLSPTQVDLDVNAVGPFTKLFLSAFVLPGRDWVNTSVCTAAAWDAGANNPNFAAANTALTNCIAQAAAVTASGVIQPLQGKSNVDGNKILPAYDPVASGNLVGSGAWSCGQADTTSTGGPSCSSTGKQATAAGDTWTLTRFGFGTVPGGSLSGTYFRSMGNLALWAYSQDVGVFSKDFLNFSQVSSCFGKAVGTSGCTVWQHGIGGTPSGTPVGLSQVSIVQRFVGVNWVQPYDWVLSAPQNIAAFPPVLYEGTLTLNPCSVDPVNGYDC